MGNSNLTRFTHLCKLARFRSTRLNVEQFGLNFFNPFIKQAKFRFGDLTRLNPTEHKPDPI